MMFLHGLEQGGLGAGRGAVDLVRHHQLAEDGARHEAELTASALALVQHFRSQNIGRHEIGGELHALLVKAQHAAERAGELGLGEARRADEEGMAAAQDGDQHLLHHLVLAEDHPADGGASLAEPLARGLDVGDDLTVCFIDARHDAHYSLSGDHNGHGADLFLMTSS